MEDLFAAATEVAQRRLNRRGPDAVPVELVAVKHDGWTALYVVQGDRRIRITRWQSVGTNLPRTVEALADTIEMC
jgi:hypothetical protein